MADSGILVAAYVVGGLIAMWFVQTIIDVFITGRLMDDPVNGKVLSTVSAYVFNCLFALVVGNSGMGLFYYLPGALLIGWLQYRKGLKIRQKISDSDPASAFD